MSACYSCAAILNKTNQSIEHVIPNSIGGNLKSSRLLCRYCNSAYGMTIDAALAKDFENLVAFVNVPRDRPKPYIIKNALAPNGDRYHLENGRNPVPVKPTIRFDSGQLYISGRNKKQVMQIASGLKRKFPGIDLEGLEKNFQNDDILLDHDLTINFSVGSDLFMRAIAKIAVNYYLMKTRGNPYLHKIINVINGAESNDHHIHYYPLENEIWDVDEVSHLIIVKGDTLLRQLHAHVVLFNTYSVVVNLCDDYYGDEVNFFYRYDILRCREIKDSVVIEYDRNRYIKEAIDNPDGCNKVLISSIQNNLGRILHIAQRRQSRLSLEDVIDKTFDKTISQYPMGTVITEAIANDVHGKLLAKFTEFLNRNKGTAK